ncbi:MAG: trehalose-6-phosphate synthase [Hamadaea sp.]|uniref:trehalose-6-phosphate synthase n=1 Tax=Hamadaea sp. TaxID=2024425 RepID=UPI0017C2AD3A|nr:trehalose-6-phosphate synthase [Hamadaea sp.]NUR69708.1 trehalose-6-phosphate synthase [Hamadaea sp.]NUT19576.1 trehalose-6-phosphate synthase [Hamadaea sp.]
MSRPDTFGLVTLAHALPAELVERTEPGSGGWRLKRRPADPTADFAMATGRRGGAWLALHDMLSRDAQVAGAWLYGLFAPSVDVAEYYLGQCRETLLPLMHDGGPSPQFHQPWQGAYRRVNHRYAVAAARLAAPEATVWLHDYHLMLVAGYLRRPRPDLRIGVQLQVPFPPVERFLRLPMRDKVMRGLLGADLLGLPDARSAANFLAAAHELTGLRRGDRLLLADGRMVVATAFPPSVDAARFARLAADPAVRDRVRELRESLGDPETVLLSIGALDEHEGVEQRLDAYAQLIAEGRVDPLTTVLVHVAAAGSEAAHPAGVQERVDRQVAQINGMFSRLGHPVVHYVRHELDPVELTSLYLAADVLLALPSRQGATLAAKEYAATRLDDTGRIVLSEFSGTAADLPEATVVNPEDLVEVKDAICAAIELRAKPDDGMAAMRSRIHAADAAKSTESFLDTVDVVTAYRYANRGQAACVK